jgi:hypothetical protein
LKLNRRQLKCAWAFGAPGGSTLKLAEAFSDRVC